MGYTLTTPETTERLVVYLGEAFDSVQSGSDSTRLETYERWITAAVKRAESWCNQRLMQTTVTWYFRAESISSNGEVWLPVLNVPLSVSSVTTRVDMFSAATTLNSGDYTLVSDGGLRILQIKPKLLYGIMTITATCGYSDATMPEDLRQVIVEMAAETRSESSLGSNRLGMTSVAGSSAGGSSTTSYQPLDSRHIERLTPYRRVFL